MSSIGRIATDRALLIAVALVSAVGFLGFVSFVDSSSAVFGADDEADGEKVALMGKIVAPKDAPAPEPSSTPTPSPRPLTLKAGKQEFQVECNRKTNFVVHESLKLKDAPAQCGAWILAARQAATMTEDHRRFPPQIVKINAIVLAESATAFQPPPIGHDLVKQRISWMYGKLTNIGTEYLFSTKDNKDGDSNIQAGPERQVVRHAKGKPEDVKANDIVFVSGRPAPSTDDDSKSEQPDIVADVVIRLATDVSAKDYAAILGPQIAPPKRPKRK